MAFLGEIRQSVNNRLHVAQRVAGVVPCHYFLYSQVKPSGIPHPCGRASPYVLGGEGDPQPPLKPPTLGGNGSGNVPGSGGTRSPTLIARRKGLQTFFEGGALGSTPKMKKAPRGAFAGAYGSVSKGFLLDSPAAEAGGNSPPLAVRSIAYCTRRGKRCGDSPYSVGGQRSPRELSSPQTTCAKGGVGTLR